MPAALLALWITVAAAPVAAGPVAAGPVAAGLDAQAAAWQADDARVVGRTAARLVDSAIAAPFNAMESRVPAYADWVYGWLSSLLTAWDLAFVGAGEAGRQIAAWEVPDPGRLRGSLSDAVQHHFEDIVIRPEPTNRELVAGWRRAMIRLSAFDARLADDRRRRIRDAAALAGSDPGPVLRRYGAPLLASSLVDSRPPPELARAALAEVETGAGGTSDRVLVRSLRPLATRAISVTTRLLIAPVAGGLLASPVLLANGLATTVATMAAVSAGVWGIDYALNEIDRALTRTAFEADLRLLVRDARAEATRLARRHARSVACDAMTATARSALPDCASQADVAASGGSG